MKTLRIILVFTIIVGALAYLSYSPLFKTSQILQNEEGTANVKRSPEISRQEERVLFFSSDPWTPYAGYADAELEGYIVDVMREIYEPLGYKVKYVNLPWSRCIRDTRDGKLTALAGADFDEVPDFIFPKETIGITRPAFFTRNNDAWKYTGLDSLSQIKLGVIQDYTYAKEIDEYIQRFQDSERILIVKGNDPLQRLISSLQAGRIDAFIENAPVVYYTTHAMGLPPGMLREAGSPRMGVLLFIPFSPKLSKARELAGIFDERIRELRSGGRLKSILEKYQIEDWLEEAAKIEKAKILSKNNKEGK